MRLKLSKNKRAVQAKSIQKIENIDLNYASVAAKAAEEKKGEDVLLLDVSKLTIISDYFLIITARSHSQIQAIANNIEEKLAKFNYKLMSKEGFVMNSWVVLDFGNLVIHIMRKEERDYYKLERFWSNATFIDKKLWRKAS